MALALRYRGRHGVSEPQIAPSSFGGASRLVVGREFRIPPEGLVLGRGLNASVRVASERVARLHARVTWAGEDALVVEDLQSTNGTEVNGARVRAERCHLRRGDLLTLAGAFDFDVVDAIDGVDGD